MSNDKAKASWDIKTTEILIKLCLQQVHKGQPHGTTYTKTAWREIVSRFKEQTGRSYDRGQLKNKLDSLKKEWMTWCKLFEKETGLGWKPDTHTVDAPDSWWAEKQEANPLYAKYRYKGLPFKDELTILFKSVVATGQQAWAPSSQRLPNEVEEDDDVYRPTLDLEEGSGDSEEELQNPTPGVSAGISTEFGDINLNTSQGYSSERSMGKRKRVGASEGQKKQRAPNARHLVDAISRIADAQESRGKQKAETSMGQAMDELGTLEEITMDLEWYSRCCELLSDPTKREIFFKLRPHKDRLMAWLKLAAYRI